MSNVDVEQRSSRVDASRRVLVSADSHGGAPMGELQQVMARAPEEPSPTASEQAPRVRILENAFKKNPEVHPLDRIKEADLDGVAAEVIYGFTGTMGQALEDGLRFVQRANDWAADLYADHLGRFAPSAALPLPIEMYGGGGAEKPSDDHIAAAAAEIRRVKGLGLRPALMPDHCDALPFNRPEWNPVWEAACEVDMPLAFHVGFGRNPVQHRGPGGAITNYAMVAGTIMETASHLAAGGVFEQFPELKVVLVECGSGWLAWLMVITDEAYVKHAHWTKPKLPMPPSEYMRRQLQVTFQEDPIGIANRHFTGLRCLMWGSDYPHHEGTWPNSQDAVGKQFAGVPEDEVDQIVRRNAVETFGFDI
jgi:predicted TIM-barrel fold metal-dependent hydrolase